MKKFFLAELGVVLTLSLVLMACSEPTDYTVVPGKLPKFRVETTVAQGGVLVTWEPVANAASYEIWRKTSGPIEGVKLDDVSGQTRYADVKSLANNLIADTEYKYTVVAVSGTDGLQNRGVESKKVIFTADQLPAPESINLGAATGLKLEVTADYRVLATWDADTNPLVTYQVSYNQPSNIASVTLSSNYILLSYTDVIADVSVKKVIGDGIYYKPSAAASGSITVFPVSSSFVTNPTLFSAARDSNNSVVITFPAYEGFSLTQYELKRIKLAFNVNGERQPDGDWTSVPVTDALFTTDISSNNLYKLNDTLPADSGTSQWMYRLIVNYPNSDLIYALLYRTVGTLNIASLITPVLTITNNSEYPATPSATNDDLAAFIYITYNIEPEAVYTLYRKQVSGLNGVALTTGVAYDWEQVTIATADKWASASSETVKVTIPEGNARTYYSYKVVVTGTGSKAGYKSVESSPVNRQFRSSITPAFGTAAAYYDLTLSTDYSFIGTRYNSAGTTTTGTVYSLSVSGLNSGASGNPPLLRSGEELIIEIVPRNGAPAAGTLATQWFTARGTTWYGNEGAGRTDVTTLGYYFIMPPVPDVGNYTVRLSVTAR